MDTYSFVDDFKVESSLSSNCAGIKKEILEGRAKLYLTSKRYGDSLLENVIQYGILECYDGIDVLTNALNAYFKKRLNGKKIIGIVLKNHTIKQKYLGDIESILENNGFTIVYILSFQNYIHQEIAKYLGENSKPFIYCNFEVSKKINFIPFIIDQSVGMQFHQDVCSLKMIPSADMYPNPVTHKILQASYDLFLYNSTYINVHSQTLYDITQNRQSYGGTFDDVAWKLVKGGYPSIDVQSHCEIDWKCKRDTIIIIGDTLCVNFYQELVEIMNLMLKNGFRVLYKTTNRMPSDKIDMLRLEFSKRENFVWYVESKLSVEELSRSIAALESGISSMCYTYPILAKRPSVLLYFHTHSKDSALLRDIFYHPLLQIRLCSDEISELLVIVQRLQRDEFEQKQWRDKIEDYCKNDLYHYGNASEFIAKWICDWYQKREILRKD